MTQDDLIKSLDYVNATREKRMHMAHLVLQKPELIEPLLQIAFKGKAPICNKACWILEFVLKKDLNPILPYIDIFTKNIHLLKLDSSVRPMAKICEIITKAYYSKKQNEIKSVLTPKHLELIGSTCFDWLIGEYKVAAKAYSMTSLLLLGRTFDWIHPELKMVLERNYASGSSAYKARARMTLERLNPLK
ncbi:adenylosuccinate lyase [Maribacter sp. ANRC-HE7]|uniref:Adenylosuccinate lyase n=1 Tax=Maribacter aquimaris TaxID=2737171 RepID=A0ABR7UYW3_9FLAO|nr:adenylosuccinate lyase [Maribacter aquimaris]MBD0776611.1 adenylosuccinate lyase [Maribacter aquimaris]